MPLSTATTASTLGLLSALSLLAGCGSSNRPATNPAVQSAVYVETNGTAANSGNSVVGYARASDGSLTLIGTYPTGGNGVGLPTATGALPFPIGGATGAVRLSPDGTRLYAVDAGSQDIAAFSVASSGALSLIGRFPTNGPAPASITINTAGSFLYVLNTGSLPDANNQTGSITGFSIATDGSLTPLANSTQPLSAAAYVDPAEVQFSPDGDYLAVTEKQPGAVGTIDIYPVANGVAGPPVSRAATGNIPFGFGFTPSGSLIVANAESVTTPNAATVTSYTATAAGALTVVSARVPDNQSAACWIGLTTDGAYAYTTNTISGSISGYSVSSTGTLGLLSPSGITAAQPASTGPIDVTVAPGNQYLYVLDSNAGASPGTLAGFAIGSGGSLTSVTTGVSGLQPGSIGLAIR